MPAAINFATLAGISTRTDGKIAIYLKNYAKQRTFDVAELPTAASNHWSDYPLGVVSILAEMGNTIPGFSPSLWGDVPLGSGLSSSASVEVATALAVMSLIGVTYPGPVLARLCQRAENEFVGAQLRHHGPIHLRQRRGKPTPCCWIAATSASSSCPFGQCGAGDCQHHGQARHRRRRIHLVRASGRGRYVIRNIALE